MAHALLDCKTIDVSPRRYLSSVGEIFAEFGEKTQDSGNVSYGVRIGDQRFFVKTPGSQEDTCPCVDHPGRVALLRNAARLHGDVQHPVLPPLLRVIESPCGPLLAYAWIDGDLLGVPRERRDDPASAFQRFRALPAADILSSLDALYDVHVALARAGWIAVDFYDGSMMYDFAGGKLHVIDIDMYSDKPFINQLGRMFGSSRFMAPEEYELGAHVDEQTTVFTMGRAALVFLGDGSVNPEAFRGSPGRLEVAARACAPERQRRFASMEEFFAAWQDAL